MSQDILVHAEGGVNMGRPAGGSLALVEIVGHDRPGILRSVSGVFAAHGVNVEELASVSPCAGHLLPIDLGVSRAA